MICAPHLEGAEMAPITSSIEIARPPDEVFSYITDPSRLTEWQESLVSADSEGGVPLTLGSKVSTTRRVGRGERTMTMEVTSMNPPSSWSLRGIDGPVRLTVNGTIESANEGARSRVTIALDFQGHGLGKLLVPLVVRRQAAKEHPENLRNLKQRLESGS